MYSYHNKLLFHLLTTYLFIYLLQEIKFIDTIQQTLVHIDHIFVELT
jgi:hypothetical protein